MQQIPLNIAFEDFLSEAVIDSLLQYSKRNFVVCGRYHGRGFGWLKTHAPAFNKASNGIPHLILTDLDQHECAPALVTLWLSDHKDPRCHLRVACPEVEGWLLSDKDSFARFLRVSSKTIDVATNAHGFTKEAIIAVTRQSRIRTRKQQILPPEDYPRGQGKEYNEALIDFVRDFWDIDSAQRNSRSLRKMMATIHRI